MLNLGVIWLGQPACKFDLSREIRFRLDFFLQNIHPRWFLIYLYYSNLDQLRNIVMSKFGLNLGLS